MPKVIPSCELCGKKPSIYNCEIEGTMMKVCEDCAKFGGVKGKSNVRIVVAEAKKQEASGPELRHLSYFQHKYLNLLCRCWRSVPRLFHHSADHVLNRRRYRYHR